MKKKLLPLAMLAGLAGSTAPQIRRTRDGYIEIVGDPPAINPAPAPKPKNLTVRMIEARLGKEVEDYNLYFDGAAPGNKSCLVPDS